MAGIESMSAIRGDVSEGRRSLKGRRGAQASEDGGRSPQIEAKPSREHVAGLEPQQDDIKASIGSKAVERAR